MSGTYFYIWNMQLSSKGCTLTKQLNRRQRTCTRETYENGPHENSLEIRVSIAKCTYEGDLRKVYSDYLGLCLSI